MKLISKAAIPQVSTAPVPVGAVVADPVIEGSQDILIVQPGGGPNLDLVAAPILLSWKSSNLPIKKLSINATIRQWMDFNPTIRNWVNTSLTSFLHTSNVLSWACPVPDQFMEELGVSEIHFLRITDTEIHIMN
jgi:hypothetical protein